jgi:Flp pilus assembly protein TadD
MHKPALWLGLAFVAVAGVLSLNSAAQENPPPKAAFPSIAAAVTALGDDEFAVRQRASDFLWRAGNPALPQLEQATRSNDPEVRMRSNLIVRNLRLGLTPESPADLQLLVLQFYDGDRNTRLRVINELRQKAAYKTLFGLMQVETDPTSRQLFFNTLQADIQRLAPQMIASNDWTVLEQCLDLGKNTEAGRAQFVAFVTLRDKLPGELERAEAEFTKSPTDATAGLLYAALLRAKGEKGKALEVAANVKAPTQLFLQGLAREQGDWQRLLGYYNEKSTVSRTELYRLAIVGTCQRLAGQAADADQTFKNLFTAGASEDVWYSGKVALLNDRPAEALTLFETNGLRPMAFDLLVQQQRHAEALKLAGITDDVELDSPWLGSLTGDKSVRTSRTIDRFSFAVSIAAELRLLGKQKQYDELRELLETVASADDSRGAYWLQLAKLERQPGRQQQLLKLYSHAADRNLAGVLTALFTKKSPKAQLWWDTLSGDPRWEDPLARLQAVAVALSPQTFSRHIEVDWPAVAKFAAGKANDLTATPAQRGKLHVLLAEAHAARNERAETESHFQAACLADPASAEAYGDWLFSGERWTDAATQFGRAAEANQANPLAWYLQGTALQRSGKEEEGRKLQNTANLMCLDAPSRYQLAMAVQERNLRAESREQWQLLQQTGNPEDQFVTIANQYLGNLLAEKEPLRAAEHWEQLRFHVLKPTSNLTEQAGYLDMALSLHRARARGLLSAAARRNQSRGRIRAAASQSRFGCGSRQAVRKQLSGLRAADENVSGKRKLS